MGKRKREEEGKKGGEEVKKVKLNWEASGVDKEEVKKEVSFLEARWSHLRKEYYRQKKVYKQRVVSLWSQLDRSLGALKLNLNCELEIIEKRLLMSTSNDRQLEYPLNEEEDCDESRLVELEMEEQKRKVTEKFEEDESQLREFVRIKVEEFKENIENLKRRLDGMKQDLFFFEQILNH
eukprot:TRINITY_DN201_c0_g1_i1.p1 TRINITY_DN201_c0_g1~~TRINITY_DN201_c0_g1_i1.p1  ORF type:complete len:179 (-),score=66.62 TRINITY_DN201_c0_g1_i1:84-620(-)